MPRKYQQEAIIKINQALNAGINPIYCAPCRTGKTKTTAFVIESRKQMKETFFILVPSFEIFDQWCLEFSQSGIDYGYINADGVTGKNKRVYVCMPMSLNNMLSVLPEKFRPDIIITDECHRSEANTWQNIYNFYPQAKRLGLTATPQRTDGKGLDNTYDIIIETIDIDTAIKDGYLTKPVLIVPEKYKIEMDVPVIDGDYDINKQAELLGKTQIIGDVISQYGNIFNGAPVLVACCTIEHAEKMTAEFNKAGWKFETISSQIPYSERKRMLRQIRNGELNGLCTVAIGIEGLTIEGLYGLIWLRRTMSLTVYIQFSSRPLTPMKGKKYGIILDPVGNCFIHGKVELHRTWSLKGKTERTPADDLAPKMKICPACNVMNSSENITCHICGYDFTSDDIPTKKRRLPVMVDGELVLLDENELTERQEEIKIKLSENKRHTKQEEKKTEMRKLSQEEKLQVLKNGLGRKNNMFERGKLWI